jgi:glycosyltransferase involved in cell wall biosynthesis
LWEQVQHEAARCSRKLGKPYVLTPHGMLTPWSLAQSRWKKKLYLAWRLRTNLRHAASLHFTSPNECQQVAPLNLGPPSIVEPNGLDLEDFDPLPPPGSFRAQYPALADKPIVIFLSRLHHKKGLDLLIPAFARLKQRDAMLVIAGPDSGGYQLVVEKLIERLGLKDRAILTGMLQGPQKVAALADADLFVLPSAHENFGIVVIEAMAAGIPPIISDGVSIHGEITDAQAGAVMSINCDPEQSINQLTTAMDRWLADPDLRRQTGKRARTYVVERFGWDPLARRWMEHYQQMISAK